MSLAPRPLAPRPLAALAAAALRLMPSVRARRSVACLALLVPLVPLVAPSTLAAQSRQADPATLRGEWIFEMEGDQQPQRVTLSTSGPSIVGRVYGQEFIGELRGDRLTFSVGDYRWRATAFGDSLVGWLGIGTDSSRWIGTRVRTPATARRFDHTPRSYHRSVSGAAAPVLRLHAGDTVRTSTVDAGGWGRGEFATRRRVTPGGNPLVGPFYVEGAVPGDVLAVRLHRVALDRTWAFSGTSLVGTAIDPSYAAERKQVAQDGTWFLDTIARTARLANPPAALRALSVPLHPFLGVIATAPQGEEAPSSRESGSFGGNLEYARLREGAMIYLPVRRMGAYLYLGDGHAAQGDGELTGDAMETSLDVTFSVQIVRWGFQDLVRAEDDEAIMSLGVGGSLDEAMRRATSDMARWLEKERGLNATEAAILMGMSMKFDIPDVVAPGYGVAARMPKVALPPANRTRR